MQWVNISIYRENYPHWRQLLGAPGYWSYEYEMSVVGKDIRSAVGKDLHLKQARVVLSLEGRPIEDSEQLFDCVLSLRVLPPDAMTAAKPSSPVRRRRARGRMMLLLQRLKQKVSLLSRRTRSLARRVRDCESCSGRKGQRQVAVLASIHESPSSESSGR